jgi:hypothetical protein
MQVATVEAKRMAVIALKPDVGMRINDLLRRL